MRPQALRSNRRTAAAAVCVAALAAASGHGLAQDEPPSVSALVITAPAEVPLPQVGEGAPLFSPAAYKARSACCSAR